MTFVGKFGDLPTMSDIARQKMMTYISVDIWRFTKGEKRERHREKIERKREINTITQRAKRVWFLAIF